MRNNRTQSIKKPALFAAIALVAGTGVAAGGSAVHSSNVSADTMPSQEMNVGHSAAAQDLRVKMNNLLSQHVTSSLDTTRAIIDGDQRQIVAAEETQRLNAEDLAAAVGSVYGDAAQSQFDALFKEHIEASNAYAMAEAAGDTNAKQMALDELYEYLDEISAFLSSAAPSLPQQDVYNLLKEHEELINKATDAYYRGDYVQSFQMEREALKQVSRIADALSSGIIAANPSKF